MRRRGRGSGNIFGGAEPEDALPEFDEFLHMKAVRRRPPSRYRVVRNARPPRPVRPWALGLRIAICSILLVLGLIGMGVSLSQAVGEYSAAGRMASAPTCAAGVDPTTTSEDCVGTVNAVAPDGAFEIDTEESIELDLPPANSENYDWVDYPGNARFDAAVGDGTSPTVVRAEYWEGQAVTLTAGDQGVTVTTDENPNNLGGAGIGGALMSFTLVLIAVLMFIGIRAIRLRWLRPGIVLQLFVSASIVLGLGAFVAGVCLVNQPARVALVAAIAPPVTLGLTGFVWLALRSGRRSRARLVRAVR
ncbi:MAG TPA: hypothetical protein VFN97_12920 [Actinospica sp.]|nr:hypothetical protein [Actinospica sp.]